MKTPLLFVLLFIATQSFSQSNKFTFGLEVSPNFTNVIKPYPFSILSEEKSGFYPAINLDIKAGYGLSSRFTITSGLGYMTIREYENFDLTGDYDHIISHRFHSYVFVPVGVKYNLGSFFISPEIAIGYNTANHIKAEYYYTNGSVVGINRKETDNLDLFNDITYPVFLTFGNEIHVKSCTISMGMKSYYGLNTIGNRYQFKGHYYGFGVFAGASF